LAGDGTQQASSPSEAKLLSRLDELPPVRETVVGNLVVLAEAPYHAASGKLCRRLLLSSKGAPKGTRARVACREAGAWNFVPSVFLVPSEQ
jgi:hypothetical protein